LKMIALLTDTKKEKKREKLSMHTAIIWEEGKSEMKKDAFLLCNKKGRKEKRGKEGS